MISVAGASDTSSVSGSGSIDLVPPTEPFGTAQFTEFLLTLDDGISLSILGGLVTVSAAPGALMVELVTPGPPGNVQNNQFTQFGNLVQNSGVVEVFDPFNLVGGTQTIDLASFGPVNLDITAAELGVSGSELTITVAFNFEIELSPGILLNGDGAIVAMGEINTATPAVLADVTRTLGLHISGGVPELLASDDTYYVLQSGPGFNPAEPHPARADFGFDTGGIAASTLDITLEEKANIGGPTAVFLLRNWNTAQWDEIARHSLSPTDQTFTMTAIPATEYINGANRIEVRARTFAILVLDPTIRGIFSHDFVGVLLRE